MRDFLCCHFYPWHWGTFRTEVLHLFPDFFNLSQKIRDLRNLKFHFRELYFFLVNLRIFNPRMYPKSTGFIFYESGNSFILFRVSDFFQTLGFYPENQTFFLNNMFHYLGICDCFLNLGIFDTRLYAKLRYSCIADWEFISRRIWIYSVLNTLIPWDCFTLGILFARL